MWLLFTVKGRLPCKERAWPEALAEVAERSLNKLLTKNLDCSGGLPDFKRIDSQVAREYQAIILDLDWGEVESRVCTQLDSAFKWCGIADVVIMGEENFLDSIFLLEAEIVVSYRTQNVWICLNWLFLKHYLLVLSCVQVCLHVGAHKCRRCGSQKKTSNPLELELVWDAQCGNIHSVRLEDQQGH